MGSVNLETLNEKALFKDHSMQVACMIRQYILFAWSCSQHRHRTNDTLHDST